MINIMYNTDYNYLPICATSIVSLLENNDSQDEICIYLFYENIDINELNKLGEMIKKYNSRIVFVDASKTIGQMMSYGLKPLRGSGYSTYMKLCASEVLEDVDRLLYIDCDTLILGDIRPLYYTDIEDFAYGMACDWGSIEINRLLSKPKSYIYYNSGVILINMVFCRKNNTLRKMIDDLSEYNLENTTIGAEQEMLNYSMGDSIFKIDMKYNVPVQARIFSAESLLYMMGKVEDSYYSVDEIRHCKSEQIITHFCLSQLIRPWYSNSNDKQVSLWMEYLFLTPWKDYERKKANISIKRKIIIFACQYIPNYIYAFMKRIHDRIIVDSMLKKNQ